MQPHKSKVYQLELRESSFESLFMLRHVYGVLHFSNFLHWKTPRMLKPGFNQRWNFGKDAISKNTYNYSRNSNALAANNTIIPITRPRWRLALKIQMDVPTWCSSFQVTQFLVISRWWLVNWKPFGKRRENKKRLKIKRGGVRHTEYQNVKRVPLPTY